MFYCSSNIAYTFLTCNYKVQVIKFASEVLFLMLPLGMQRELRHIITYVLGLIVF